MIKDYKSPDSWALITGCTSGIGEDYAIRLAKVGFNIVLVSRNIDRLRKVDNSIHWQCPDVKTMVI